MTMGKIKRVNPVIFLIIFFTAVGFGVWGMLTPPPGEIANSVLILIAQFLVLAASVYGFEVHFDIKEGKFHAGENHTVHIEKMDADAVDEDA